MDWGNGHVLSHRDCKWIEIDPSLLEAKETKFTLVFPLAGKRVLLGRKKRGFAKGKFNGFGGKLEPQETVEDAAVRELREECGLRVEATSLRLRAKILIVRPVPEGPPVLAQLLVFTCSGLGEDAESEEMAPRWFGVDELPYDQMWPEARLYLPLILHGEAELLGLFQYGAGDDRAILEGWRLGIKE